jgi:hypothetical protein
MRVLTTVQKREKLNEVFAVDEPGNGGANHEYKIFKKDKNPAQTDLLCNIQFQNGARKEELTSIPGVLDTDLLEVVRDRLGAFQSGPFSSEYNEKALEHIELALMYMNRRVEDRIERNVLGTNQK